MELSWVRSEHAHAAYDPFELLLMEAEALLRKL